MGFHLISAIWSHLLHTHTHTKAHTSADGGVRATEQFELCVFKVALMRKALLMLSAGPTFTQHIGMLGMREELHCGL